MGDAWGPRAGPSLRARLQGAGPPREPSPSVVKQACTDRLVEGVDPEVRRATPECDACGESLLCASCGHKQMTVETHGEDAPGIREAVESAADRFEGVLSGEEFADCLLRAVEEVLQDLDDERQADMTAAVHRTLGEFEEDSEA